LVPLICVQWRVPFTFGIPLIPSDASPGKDKAPCPLRGEMGPSICFIRGLRVSRLLDLRAVSGSKSDTPTRAKNCEGRILKCAGKNKKNRDRSLRAPGSAWGHAWGQVLYFDNFTFSTGIQSRDRPPLSPLYPLAIRCGGFPSAIQSGPTTMRANLGSRSSRCSLLWPKICCTDPTGPRGPTPS